MHLQLTKKDYIHVNEEVVNSYKNTLI